VSDTEKEELREALNMLMKKLLMKNISGEKQKVIAGHTQTV
jgi:hypothetical protein